MKVVKYTLVIVRSSFCNGRSIELLYLVLMTSEKSAKRLMEESPSSSKWYVWVEEGDLESL